MRRVYIGKFSHHVRERDVERFFRSEGRIREVLMKDGFAFVEFEHTTDAEAAVKHLDGRDLNGDRVHVEFAKGPPRTPRDGGMRGGGAVGMGRGISRRDGPPRRDFRSDRGGDRSDRGDRGGRDRGDRDDNRGRGGGVGSGGGISYAEKYGPPRNTDYRVIVENLSSRVSWQDLKDLMRQAGEVTFADAHKRERNMGIVDFATVKDMRQAIDTLNDTEFHGRRIKVYEDKSRRRNGPGGGGGGGGGRDFGGRRSGGRSRSRSPRRYHSSSSRSRSRERSRTRSRSRSRDRASVSRSRSRSPIVRDRDAPSRSRSPVERETRDAQSRSRSPIEREDRNGASSRSRSPADRDRDAPSRSRSPSVQDRDAKSRSKSPSVHDRDALSRSASPNNVQEEREAPSRSRSRSASRSPVADDDN